MRVLLHSTGQDTGGQGSRIKELLERHAEGIEVRSAIVTETYIGYPTDVLIRNQRHAQELFDWADVLHLRHRLTAWQKHSGDRARPTVLHHHGTFFIDHHRTLYAEADRLGFRQFVSGLEMQEMEPGTTWLPQPHDMDALGAIRRKVYRRHTTLRVVQCPTRPSKGTAIVEQAVKRLAERYDFEFEVISGVSWTECLERKARADIFIDQIGPAAWGYGNNAVEAWAMGMPVISEAPDPKVHARMLATWGELPFLSTHGSTVEAQLERLLESKSLREEYATRGEAHGRAFHDYPVVARQLAETYQSQPPSPGSAQPSRIVSVRDERTVGKRLFIVATGQDTCGWGIRIQQGFNRHAPDWSVRSSAATQRYQEYPIDLPFERPVVREFYQAAAVIQLRNSMHGWTYFDDGAGKPTVLLYHGSHYRKNHVALATEARRIGAVQIVSTFDLTLLEGDTTWIGSPYSGEELRALREQHYQPSERIRIAHAPTDRRIKGTDLFLAAVDRLKERYPIELDLIENQTWAECLRRKATADIFYDQLGLGYGGNAVEAWGMGIPVIAGVTDPKVRAAMRRHWGQLPFPQTTPETLERRLEALITSEQTRREWSDIGSEHFARWHDERVVVPQLAEIYNSAKPTIPGPSRARTRDQGRDRPRTQAEARERYAQLHGKFHDMGIGAPVLSPIDIGGR